MKTKTLNLLVLSLFYISVSSSLISQGSRQKCVLDTDGKIKCVLSSVSSVVHMREKAPCARKDVMCWCKKAKDYTNDVRRKKGVSKMLKLGTQSQMDNAMKYAAQLGRMGFLKHQDLSKATKEVGCQRWMGGENLAFNYESGDIAKMCVQQWIESRGHFENLVRDWFEEVVVGFHFQPDGRVYCVQTFALPYPYGTFGSPTDKGCKAVGSSLGPTTPTPVAVPAADPSMPKPTPKSPVSTSPAPRTTTVTSAPMSCRCIRYGKGCRRSIAQDAGNGCMSDTQRSKQPRTCKMDCCEFCKVYADVGVCSHRHLTRICGSLY